MGYDFFAQQPGSGWLKPSNTQSSLQRLPYAGNSWNNNYIRSQSNWKASTFDPTGSPYQQANNLYASAWGVNPAGGGNMFNGTNPGGYNAAQIGSTVGSPTGGAGAATGGAAADLGGYIDAAIEERQGKQGAAEGAILGMINDPNLGNMISLAMSRAKENAIPQDIMNKIRGASSQRSAANAASLMRNTQSRAARSGITGTARDTLLRGAQNRSASQGARRLDDIDVKLAMQNMTRQDQNLSMANSLFGTRAGLVNRYAGTLTGYDPLAMLQQGSSIASPLGQLGYGQGLL